MQSRLERIRKAGAGPQYFLRSLQVLGGAVASAPQTKIDALSYREQSLDLQVTAPDLAAMNRLSQHIAQQGLSADIQSSTPVAGGVEAHLQVHAPGAKK
jgi:type II secretory pathway component PulL